MPIYSYNCPDHGEFEQMKKISERGQAECPICGERCSNEVTAPQMIKGGFYDKSYTFSKKF